MRSMVEAYLKQLPRSYLYYGYATLIDLVAPFLQELNDFRHQPLHPDLYDCNPSMPFANGYPISYVPQRCDSAAFRISFMTLSKPEASAEYRGKNARPPRTWPRHQCGRNLCEDILRARVWKRPESSGDEPGCICRKYERQQVRTVSS